MSLLLLRPYYGINVHGDMHGDLGISDHLPHIYPDVSFVNAGTVAERLARGRLDVIDANLERALPQAVMDRLSDRYDDIVIKAAAPTLRCDLDFARELKRRYPAARLHLAGYAAAFVHRWIEQNRPEIDVVARQPIDGHVRNLLAGVDRPLSINELPSPDYGLFPFERMRDMDGVLRGGLYMSRGCAVGCTYCPYPDFYGKAFDYREVGKVLADIEHLMSLGFHHILFRDQYFAANRGHARAVCNEILRRRLRLKWRCETRLESLTPELIDLMAEAGLEWISFGVESASEQTLRDFHRPPYDEPKLRSLIERLHQRGVRTLAFFVIGFPEDTWETLKDTYELAERLGTTTLKFSIYAPCTTNAVPEELRNPSLYVPFTNETSLTGCRALSADQLHFLQSHMTRMYHTQRARSLAPHLTDYLKGIYEYHAMHEQEFQSTVERLNERLQTASILDL